MALEIGSPAPDFTLVDEKREKVTLSDLRGRNVVLIFYPLDFSGVCTKELHQVTDLRERFGDAEVFGISVDSHHSHRVFKETEGLQVRLLSDFQPKGAVASLYGAYLDEIGFATRETVVIDKDGIVRHIQRTDPATARDPEEVLAALAACPV